MPSLQRVSYFTPHRYCSHSGHASRARTLNASKAGQLARSARNDTLLVD